MGGVGLKERKRFTQKQDLWAVGSSLGMAHTDMSGVVRIRTSRQGGATGQDRTGPGFGRAGRGSKGIQVVPFVFRSGSIFFFGLPASSTHGEGKMACAVLRLRVCLPTWQHHRRARDGRDKRETDVHAGWTAYLVGTAYESMRTYLYVRACSSLKMPMLARDAVPLYSELAQPAYALRPCGPTAGYRHR